MPDISLCFHFNGRSRTVRFWFGFGTFVGGAIDQDVFDLLSEFVVFERTEFDEIADILPTVNVLFNIFVVKSLEAIGNFFGDEIGNAATVRSLVRALRETLRGMSGLSITPRSGLRNSGIISSQWSLTNT